MHNPLQYLDEELDHLREKNLCVRMRTLQGPQKALAQIDGRSVVNLSSNNYLGLTTHPKVRQRAIEAIELWGVGSGSVRAIAGTMEIHLELERKIAAFKHTDAAIVFQTGFSANAGTVAALLGKGDVVISDALNHASVIDGCRLARVDLKIYPHRDMSALADVLEETKEVTGRKLLVTDGVFAMDGDIAPLQEIVELGERNGCIIMVDDAHANGVIGRNGRGTIDYFRLHGRVHIQVGTLSKAIGSIGGFVCGSQSLIDYLHNRARHFLLSTSHPPAVAAASLAAFEVLEEEPQLVEKLWENTRIFKEGLNALGFRTGSSETPITPVLLGKPDVAVRFSEELFQEGVFAQSITFPTVPLDQARVRTIVTAAHTEQDISSALAAFEAVGKRLSLV